MNKTINQEAGNGKKPNILMVMADQWRGDYIGCTGGNFMKTPHIDAIAGQGVIFERNACNSPLCVPSRTSIATGMYPSNVGLYENKDTYPVDRVSYMQMLKNSGYNVGVVGKTHIHPYEGYKDLERAGNREQPPFMFWLGFTNVVEIGGKSAGERRYGDTYVNDPNMRKRFQDDYIKRRKLPTWYAAPSELDVEHYQDYYIGQRGYDMLKELIDDPSEKPWYINVSFEGPHGPWDAPQEYADRYLDTQFPDSPSNLVGKPDWVKRRSTSQSKDMTPADLRKTKASYAGMISLIDDWVGRMRKLLEDKGQSSNTIIIICADHGEMMGDFGMFAKTVMYEGALRTPLIISHPEGKFRGKSQALSENVDIYPTILDLAGVDYSCIKPDGVSLKPILMGEDAKHKDYQFSEVEDKRMVFDGRYKYIVKSDDISELYDLRNDPKELKNIASEDPENVKRLSAVLETILLTAKESSDSQLSEAELEERRKKKEEKRRIKKVLGYNPNWAEEMD